MELKELKSHINNYESLNFPLFFVCEKETFLVRSYIDAIATNFNLDKRRIGSLSELKEYRNNLVNNYNFLFIYSLNDGETIKEEDIINLKIIILTSHIPEKNFNYINFPKKLEEWQIEDYMRALVPGLDQREISWLSKITKDVRTGEPNIDRLTLEAQKIGVFDKKDQEHIFAMMNADNAYSDLNSSNIFTLVAAIMRKDINTIDNIIKDIDCVDVEGLGLITLLLKQFKDLIDVTFGSKDYNKLGMTEKQYNSVCKYERFYKDTNLINIYEFLNDLDYRLKTGLLDINNKQLVTYVIFNVLR